MCGPRRRIPAVGNGEGNAARKMVTWVLGNVIRRKWGGIPCASRIRRWAFRGVKGTLRDSGAVDRALLGSDAFPQWGPAPPCPRSSPLDPPGLSATEVGAFSWALGEAGTSSATIGALHHPCCCTKEVPA
jgi:hypothetical protein